MEMVIETLSELGKVETATATAWPSHDLHDLAEVNELGYSFKLRWTMANAVQDLSWRESLCQLIGMAYRSRSQLRFAHDFS